MMYKMKVYSVRKSTSFFGTKESRELIDTISGMDIDNLRYNIMRAIQFGWIVEVSEDKPIKSQSSDYSGSGYTPTDSGSDCSDSGSSCGGGD